MPGREASRMRPRAPSGKLGYGGVSPGGAAALDLECSECYGSRDHSGLRSGRRTGNEWALPAQRQETGHKGR